MNSSRIKGMVELKESISKVKLCVRKRVPTKLLLSYLIKY